MIIDTLLGTINAFFVENSYNGSALIKGIFKKLGVFACAIIFYILIYLTLVKNLQPVQKEMVEVVKVSYETIVVLLCLNELVSFLANLEIVTGIPFSKVPAIKNIVHDKLIKEKGEK